MSSAATESEPLLALPFDPTRGDPKRWTKLFAFVAEHPAWFSLPGATKEQMMISASAIVADSNNIIYEVWRGSEFVGVLSLTKITPGVDATVHFVFMDRSNLKGKRKLLLRFLKMCYEDLRFHRLTFEVPEPFGVLIRFIRRHLGFTYEGERAILADTPEVLEKVQHVPGISTWASRVGSRREQCHWHDGSWADLMILRQTAPEFQAFLSGRDV